jgi:hypothetical protein
MELLGGFIAIAMFFLFALYLGLASTYMLVVLVRALRNEPPNKEDEYEDEPDEEFDCRPKRKPSTQVM